MVFVLTLATFCSFTIIIALVVVFLVLVLMPSALHTSAVTLVCEAAVTEFIAFFGDNIVCRLVTNMFYGP